MGAGRTSTLALIAIAVCAVAPSRAAAKPILGFNDTAETFVARADAVKGAGAKMARIPVSWERAEPRPGRFDFSWLDPAVTALGSRGIRPLFVISAAPAWAAPDCDRTVTLTCAVGEGYESAYARMALTLLQRYRSSQVQAWNEPNLSGFGAIDPGRMAELTNVLYRVAPRKVIGPGASPSPSNFLRYTARTYRRVNRHVPLALNLYPRSIFAARRLGHDWRRARAIARHRQIWVTEIGFSAYEFGERGQARRSAAAYRFLARNGARAIIFHCLQDPTGTGSDWLDTLGVLRADGRRKPAYRALRRAALRGA